MVYKLVKDASPEEMKRAGLVDIMPNMITPYSG